MTVWKLASIAVDLILGLSCLVVGVLLVAGVVESAAGWLALALFGASDGFAATARRKRLAIERELP